MKETFLVTACTVHTGVGEGHSGESFVLWLLGAKFFQACCPEKVRHDDRRVQKFATDDEVFAQSLG